MEKTHPLYGAKWIAGSRDCQSPVISRTFSARKPVKAELHITGLGYFDARINGKPVTELRLLPAVSEFGPRDLTKFSYPILDTLSYRIYYCSFDVTGLLEEENLLTVRLGNGWYRQLERRDEGPLSFGDQLKCIYCLTLHYPGGMERILSDGSECWNSGHIVYNDLFIGEVHDFSKPSSPSAPVEVLEDEGVPLCPQIGPGDKIARILQPRKLWVKDGKEIWDAGENISGLVRLTVHGKAGERVVLRFAEELSPDGALDFDSAGAGCICLSGRQQIQEDVCICGGEEAVFEPLFCWHGFRYFEIEGPGASPEVLVIHSDVAVTGQFRSDSEGLNFLYDAFIRTQQNNMHGSIPSDCPHRERLGYTGDGQVAAAAAMLTLDVRNFYRKWMRDILDTQDQIGGHVQHTAPFSGGGGGPVGWGGAIAVVPYRFWKHYGDTGLLEESWESLLRWISYIRSRMEKGLIVREEEKGWCLGDWLTLEPIQLPESFVNTCLFIRYLDMLIEAAAVIGKEEDIPHLRELQQQCREAVRNTYFDEADGHFLRGIQGADAYGLHAGLGDDRTKRLLAKKYDALGHFDTGFIGTDVLLEELFRLGAYETAYKLLSSREPGSFLYMKDHGATTLWERWDGKESHDHPMFGGCLRHLFSGFLGIRQAYGTGGYKSVTVEPQLPKGVDFMEGAFPTDKGMLSVSVRRVDGHVISEVRIP